MRHLISLAFLAAAILLYYLGIESGAVLAFVASSLCELVFWKRVFKRRQALRS